MAKMLTLKESFQYFLDNLYKVFATKSELSRLHKGLGIMHTYFEKGTSLKDREKFYSFMNTIPSIDISAGDIVGTYDIENENFRPCSTEEFQKTDSFVYSIKVKKDSKITRIVFLPFRLGYYYGVEDGEVPTELFEGLPDGEYRKNICISIANPKKDINFVFGGTSNGRVPYVDSSIITFFPEMEKDKLVRGMNLRDYFSVRFIFTYVFLKREGRVILQAIEPIRMSFR